MARNDLQPYPVNTALNIIGADIAYGIARDSYSCVIAHAIYRQFPDALRVRVTKKTISWSSADTDTRYVYPTPPIADRKYIKPFDTDEPIKPGRITLTGGQFRGVDHHQTRENREKAQQLKHDDPAAYQRRHGKPRKNGGISPSSRVYERYLPDSSSL